MSKKGHLVGYYLVSVDNYKTLSELKNRNIELEKKLSDSLKYQKLATNEKVTQLETQIKKLEAELGQHKSNNKESEKKTISDVSSETYQPSTSATPATPEIQQGTGATDSEQFRAKLLSTFQDFLQSHFPQSGTGGAATDLTPIVPIPLPEKVEVKPSEYATDLDVHNVEPENHDFQLDEDKLLANVKTRYKEKAQKLLAELKKHSDAISVGPNGEIFISGELLPEANFYTLFPLLYRATKNYRRNTALVTLADELATLGLGHLILRNYSVGITPKGTNYFKGRAELKKFSHKKWYYLGDDEWGRRIVRNRFWAIF